MSDRIEIFPHSKETIVTRGLPDLVCWGPISTHVMFGDYETHYVSHPPAKNPSNRERQARNRAPRAAKNV